MRTIIVDDERLAREELKRLLNDIPEVEIIGEASNPLEAIEKINELKPDLIFLDIEMPVMSGLEMLKKLNEIPKVIFTTAFENYAVQAFEANAVDYLLKPVEASRLSDSVKKLNQKDDDFLTAETEISSRSHRKLTVEDSIFLKDGEKCFFIKLGNIRWIESEGNYARVYFDQSKILILKTLNGLEDRLDENVFFRANRKSIVNVTEIKTIENWFNGGLLLELSAGEKIEVSRRQAVRFKEFFML